MRLVASQFEDKDVALWPSRLSLPQLVAVRRLPLSHRALE